MSRETMMGCRAAFVVLEALEVAVREAVAAMDESFGEQVWPNANAFLTRHGHANH
ncbi:hypothetical protein [Rhodococcus erythropolis]|uniref:hypothetical protein n=1 Tax=Rhodococcus erythropolis TaxID=1833 RepID=UPI0012D45F39|nr:hypothetical protein [Rhodococcus erythropolis]